MHIELSFLTRTLVNYYVTEFSDGGGLRAMHTLSPLWLRHWSLLCDLVRPSARWSEENRICLWTQLYLIANDFINDEFNTTVFVDDIKI